MQNMHRVPMRLPRRKIAIIAAEIMAAHPLLPVEDPALRENFIERVFAYHRWKGLLAGGVTMERLRAFHGRHELHPMAHGAAPMRRLGRLLGEGGDARRRADARAAQYGEGFMALLLRTASRKSHARVLRQLTG